MMPRLSTRPLSLKKPNGYGTDLSLFLPPKHGSWLNMAEIELHVLNGQCLNRPIDSIGKITSEVEAWVNNRNNKTAKINWRFTNDQARIKLKRLYPSILY